MYGPMLYVELCCLFFTLFAVWMYIRTGVYSRAHRLLPLLFCIVAVFGFYQIVKLRTLEFTTFHLLEDFLIVQILHVLWSYVLDYNDIRPKIGWEIASLCYTIGTDFALFALETDSIWYYVTLISFMSVFIAVITGTIIYSFLHFRYSAELQMDTNHMVIALYVPMILIYVQEMAKVELGVFSLLSMEFAIAILTFQIISGRLIDTKFFLNERVFQEAENPMIFFDTTYFLLGANKAAQRIFPNVAEDDHLYLRDADAQDRMAQFLEHYGNGDSFTYNGRTYQIEVQDLEYRHIPRGSIMTLQDVTEQLESLEEAKEQSRLKAQFLARASHDLRSPLHAIIGISEILSGKKEISRKNRSMIEHIHTSGNTLLKIVNSILDYSKIEAGAFTLNESAFELSPILLELAQVVVVNLQSKRIDFSIEMETAFPETIKGDRLRITEMMQNILSNAVKFTEEGSIRGQLAFQREEDGRLCFYFRVIDSGHGMSEEELATIFEEYNTYAENREQEGTGLGMTILRELARMMGGDAYAKSDGVSGSEVGFYIYVSQVGDKMLPPEIIDGYSLIAADSMLMTVTPDYCYPEASVLLADDMEINRQIFERMTADWGFHLDLAENGLQALECVRNHEYDLIILDYLMPVMGGDVAVKEIKKLTDVPVMLLSANVFDGNMEEMKALGFDEILTKPLDMKQIKKALEGYLPEDKQHKASKKKKKEQTEKQLEGQYRTIVTFHDELKRTVTELEELFAKDKEEYRIRVHGLKGAARQIGYDDLATQSEIQEMAVQSGHLPFAQEHMAEYRDSIADALVDIQLEIAELERRLKEHREKKKQQGKTTLPKEELYEKLRAALDAYDAVAADGLLEELKLCDLSEQENSLIFKVGKALNNFDYEGAAELLS